VAAQPYNLARFDLVSIRLAVACARHGSLTQAAQESHLALAAASRRIRDLESALGEPLFERHARGVRTTAAGRVFARHGVALLQALEQMGGELADLRHGVTRHLRLCASTASISQFLPPLLASYARHQPQVRIDLEEQVSERVAATLREGRCDLGVFVEGPDTTGLSPRPFRRDELVMVLPRKHRLAGRKPLAFADALDEDWISLNTGAAMLQQLQQAALAANRPLRCACRCAASTPSATWWRPASASPCCPRRRRCRSSRPWAWTGGRWPMRGPSASCWWPRPREARATRRSRRC
jgi:molybdate transport repressor ModE-like protein